MGAATIDTSAPLRAVELCYSYRAQPILDGLNLEVAAGEVFCLLGHNGVGKTTTINQFLGFLRPDSGSVTVLGHDPISHPEVIRDRVGYVPENAALYGHLNAVENLDYFFAVAGMPALPREELLAHLEQVGFPLGRAQQSAASFSKGMRQKVVLALALAKQARILLLDEPTTGLDPQSARELSERMDECRARGVAILVVTHDLPWAQRTADRLGIMEGGRLQQMLRCAELTPAELASQLLGASPVTAGSAP